MQEWRLGQALMVVAAVAVVMGTASYILRDGITGSEVGRLVFALVVVAPVLLLFRFAYPWAWLIAGTGVAILPLLTLFAFGGLQQFVEPKTAYHMTGLYLMSFALLLDVPTAAFGIVKGRTRSHPS